MHIANLYHTHTSWQLLGAYERLWLTASKPFVQFYVKACHDAKIALSYFPLDASKSTFEIILGANGNTESLINFIDMSGQSTENTKVSVCILAVLLVE